MSEEETSTQTEAATHLADAEKAFTADSELETPQGAKEPEKPESKKQKGLLGDALGANTVESTPEAPEETPEAFEEPPKESKHRPEWDKLKKSHADSKDRIAELESKLSGSDNPEAVDSLRASFEKIKEENEQMSTRLKELDFKSHPEYYNKFVQPVEDSKEQMAEILKMEDLDVDLNALMQMKGKQFAEEVSDILDQLSSFQRPEFGQLARDAHKTILAGEAASEKPDEFVEGADTDFKARTRAAFDKVGEEYGQLFSPTDVDESASKEVVAENSAYNEALQNVNKAAEQIAFGGLDDTAMSRVAHESALFRFLLEHGLPRVEAFAGGVIGQRDAQIKELQAELGQFQGATPSLGMTSGESSTSSEGEMSHLDAARLIKFGE